MKRKEILSQKNSFLSPLLEEDLTSIKNWRNEQMDVLRQNVPLTDEDQKNWFAKIQKDKQQVIFAIISGDELIGYCGITYIDHDNLRGEISFVLKTGVSDEDYKMIFLEVLDMLKTYAFDILKLHKLFTETYNFRGFHIGILEEFGLNRDGRYKDHIFHKGKYYDSLIHSLINDRS